MILRSVFAVATCCSFLIASGPAVSADLGVVGAGDVDAVMAGVVGVFKDARFAVGHVFPQGQVRVAGVVVDVFYVIGSASCGRVGRGRRKGATEREDRDQQRDVGWLGSAWNTFHKNPLVMRPCS